MSPDNFASTEYGGLIALATGLVLIFAVALLGMKNPKKPLIEDLNGIPKYFATDTSFYGYGPDKLFRMLGEYKKPQNFDAHRSFIKYDLVFALVYAVCCALIITYFQGALVPGAPASLRYLWLAPVLAALCDIAEGLSMWAILNNYQSGTTGSWLRALAVFSAVMTVLKSIFLVITAALLITGVTVLLLKKAWHLKI